MKIDLPNKDFIALKEVATYSIERGDVSINHLDGRREIQVSADLKNSEESSLTDILANDIRFNIMPKSKLNIQQLVHLMKDRIERHLN